MLYGKIERIEPQKIDGKECRYRLTIRSPKLNGNFLLAKLSSNNSGASRNVPIYEIVEKQGEFLCPWGLVFRNDTKENAKCVVLGLSLDHPDWEKPFNLAAFSTSGSLQNPETFDVVFKRPKNKSSATTANANPNNPEKAQQTPDLGHK